MRKVLVIVVAFIVGFPLGSNSQQTDTASASASGVLAQSLTAMGSSTISDVTLTGTAERIVGSDDQTGAVTYRATPTANRLDISFSSGTLSEIRGPSLTSPDGVGGNWIALDGTIHEIARHNLYTDSAWFPLFNLTRLTSNVTSLTNVGQETLNGNAVTHLRSVQPLQTKGPQTTAALVQHLSQIDLYLDASTLLPAAIAYNVHPDNNANQDIPVMLTFSDYRSIAGFTVPFHIQQSMNGSLLLDLQFQQAVFNSGLSTSSAVFMIQ